MSLSDKSISIRNMMEKNAISNKAIKGIGMALGSALGIGGGGTIGKVYGSIGPSIEHSIYMNSRRDDNTNTSKLVKKLAPDVKILNSIEMEKILRKNMPWYNPIKDETAEIQRKMLEEQVRAGNAYAVPGEGVFIGGEANPSVVKHELGHMLQDKDSVAFPTLTNHILGRTLKSEEEAWGLADKNYGDLDTGVRDTALNTYRGAQTGSRVGAAVGAALGTAASLAILRGKNLQSLGTLARRLLGR